MRIPFNRPYMAGRELEYIRQAHANGRLAGDGAFTKRCSTWLQRATGCERALLTHSCTGALELAALLLDIRPGDEIIMPSFTFVSTANAFVLRGAVPVFVDVRSDTLNIDERGIEAAVTPRTRAIAVVHYAGVACEMDAILEIAARHRLAVVEDAAQAVLASYRGRPLGAIGDLGTLSFHETKNVLSGEGGALLLRDAALVARAEILWEKGTNRSSFFRGEVDKYTWVDIGSSFLPGELIAAFLCAQLEQAEVVTERRRAVWERYYAGFADLERAGRARRPVVPPHCGHNGHLFYLLLPDEAARARTIAALANRGIGAHFHYVPLHSSPAGRRYGRACGSLDATDDAAARLVRLPLWPGIEEVLDEVIDAVRQIAGA